jgi:hypothetical protein
MEVRIAVLADFASLSEGRKLNILGIFTNLVAENEPVVHPQMRLVTAFEFNSSEAGDKNIKIELVDEDGKDIFSMSGVMHIEREPDGRPTMVNQILNFNNMVFPKFGEYEFRVLLDGHTVCTIPLNVLKTPSKSQ